MSKEKKKQIPFPRPGSAEYNFLLEDGETKKKILKRWKWMNKLFIIPLYRAGILPLLGVHKIFLLLYTKGRITGKIRITPVEYRKKDGIVHVVAGRGNKAHWFKNMVTNPESVMIKIGFKKTPASFEIIEEIAEKNAMFKWYEEKYPRAGKMLFGWDPKTDDPETTDFTSFSKMVEIMKFNP